MANPYFRFKRFTIWHDKCAMKVGTDGVLLGAWTQVDKARRILDIGTGTGLVALMLAQRSPSTSSLLALEIDGAAVKQAQENVARSAWKERVEVVQADFRTYRCEEKFDVIVCNPPYFTDSLECPDEQRSTARHAVSLTYDDLFRGVAVLLSEEGGAFSLVIPVDAEEKVKSLATRYSLYPARQLYVVTKPGGTPKRTLLTFTFHKQECQRETLLIELSRHHYSPEYISLTREYYLKME